MKRSDLQDLEEELMKEWAKRKGLGGYSQDAEGLLLITRAMVRLLRHMIDTYPEEKKANGKVPKGNS